MTPFISFLNRMGLLHDAAIQKMIWRPEERILRFEIDDLCSNFLDLPEYPGLVPGHIELREIERITFTIDFSDPRLNIDEFNASSLEGGKFEAIISFWPTGKIAAKFRTVDFQDVPPFAENSKPDTSPR